MLCTIVGAGSGLGIALAERFSHEGFRVAMICRSPEKLAAWHRSRPHPRRFLLHAADAADEAALDAGFSAIRRWGGETQVLIYNVADLRADRVEELTPDVLAETMRSNVGGALVSVQAVLPDWRQRRSGTILFTGGGLALEPYPMWGTLAAGKAALRSVALGLHKALLPAGVHVAVVAVCGIVRSGTRFDPALIAEEYWRLHTQPLAAAARELVYFPVDADPFYNDPAAEFRETSLPITGGEVFNVTAGATDTRNIPPDCPPR